MKKGTTYTQQEEAALWQAFKKGSELAFSKIFKTYYNDLYFYGLKFSGNEDFVKDTLQELFSEIWARRAKLGDVSYIKAYLIKSFRRKMLKTGKTERRLFKAIEARQQLSKTFELSAEDFIISQEIAASHRTKLLKTVAKLNKSQKEIIYLRFYNSLDYKEIAEITGLKYQSVRNSMHKALKVLRKAFK